MLFVSVPLGVEGNPASPGFCLRLAGIKRSAVLQGLENGVLKQVLQLFRRQIPAAGFTVDFDTLPVKESIVLRESTLRKIIRESLIAAIYG